MSTTRRSFLTALGAVVAGAPLAGWAWIDGLQRPAAPVLEPACARVRSGARVWLALDSARVLEPNQRCVLVAPVPAQIDAAALVGLAVRGAPIIIDGFVIEGQEQLLMPVPSQILRDLHSPMMHLPFVRGGDVLQLTVHHSDPEPRPIAATWDLLVH